MYRSLALLLCLLAACESSREVTVQVSIPGLDSTETPAAGVAVLALPYDRDSILAQLAAHASKPRPNTAPLDTAFADFRDPFTTYAAAAYHVTKLRGSGAPAESLRAAEQRQHRARVTLDSARGTFVRRTDSLRAALRAWEDSTYGGWDSIVRGLAVARRQDPIADTTNATGSAQFTLPPGQWWIYARSWDAGDPNAEWYWNLPATSDTVVLSSKTGRHQPRY